MKAFYTWIVKHRIAVVIVFAVLSLLSAVMAGAVSVNYDIAKYLPDNTKSTAAIEVLGEQFEGGIPNARVMVHDLTVPQALEYKERLRKIDGVTAVTWLDDAADITTPLSTLDKTTLESYYKDGTALFTLTVDDKKAIAATDAIRELIGEDGALTGTVAATADATTSSLKEVLYISVIAVLFTLAVLALTTTSWLEPLVVLLGLGVAVIINNGTNLIFGEISFVTNAAGSVLQLAVSLDYSVFLLHRFEECRRKNPDADSAMVDALCKSTGSILSSGLTTVIGFLALVLMQFKIGPDLGLALAKGVAISLITVFTFMPALILTVYKALDRTRHRSLMPSFKWLGKAVLKIAVPAALIFGIVIAPSYLASNANSYLYGASQIFSEKTRYGSDTAKILAEFGESDTYVLMVPKGDTATETELSKELHTLPEITSIISYVDMAGAEIPHAYLDKETLSLLESEEYTRMVISVNTPVEGESTFPLVANIREIADKYYPDAAHLAGEGVSTYDLKETITADMTLVNLVAIGAVFLILLAMLRSISLPILLVLSIETAVWLNLSVPYFTNSPVYYLAYLIISSVQLGATVDYAILMTDRYRENRQSLDKKQAVVQTVADTFVSIMTSGGVMTVTGFLLGWMSSNQLLGQLGVFIGRGAIFSLAIVILVLPGLLYIFDSLAVGRKKGKKMKKAVSAALAILICISSLTGVAFAQGNSTPKEESVYVNLTAAGEVKNITVVNIYDTNGTVTDYGDYTSVRNMTTTAPITYKNGVISAQGKGKLYIEGALASKAIPWDISVRYFIDGKEYSAAEVAGKSGKLRIALTIDKNEAYDGGFFEGFALQASVTLDTKICSDIIASGATAALVGSKKQLTYTILPGKGADIEICAAVKDFEMAAISINAIKLELGLDIDMTEMTDKVDTLTDAIALLNEGVTALSDGSKQLEEGLKLLDGNSPMLTDGSKQVRDALWQIKSALDGVEASTDELDMLINGSAQVKDGIAQLAAGIDELHKAASFEAYKEALAAQGLDIEVLQEGNKTAIAEFDDQIAQYDRYIAVLKRLGRLASGVVDFLEEQKGTLETMRLLITGNDAAITATDIYLTALGDGAGQLKDGADLLNENYALIDDGINQLVMTAKDMLGDVGLLAAGIETLYLEYRKFDEGVATYTGGVSALYDGYKQLASGIAELLRGTNMLYDETKGMDSQIPQMVEDMMAELTGERVPLESFVSDKNTSVSHVQFVMQTEAVKAPAAPIEVPAEEIKLTFWQKLIALFTPKAKNS